MDRRRLLGAIALLGALMVSVLVIRATRPRVPPRNLILISIDTLRADHLGTYGYARDTSPNLDRLARRSTLFTQAVAQAPNTLPSHMSLLTSLYASAHGVLKPEDRLPDWRVTFAEILKGHGFATRAFVDGGFLRSRFGFAQGFDSYAEAQVRLARILDQVEGALDSLGTGRSFVFIHCYDVHAPYTPRPPFDTRFEEVRYAGDFEPTLANLGSVIANQRRLTPDDLRHVVARYDGAIAYTDDQLGRLFASLERRRLLESTLIVVTSDHGEEFLEHGSMTHWQTYYMPILHVPLIFYVPGESPRRIDGPVELIDVIPTALELLGLPPYAEAMGESLVPLMNGRPRARDEAAYAEPTPQRVSSTWYTVVTDRFQFLHDPDAGRSMLFDIRSDPAATTDLAARESALTRDLLAVLEQRRQRAAEAARRGDGAPIHSPGTPLDEETRRQLRALGYAD